MYELNQVLTFPLFTTAEAAYAFIERANASLAQAGDDRTLQSQICTSQVAAYEMFQALFVLTPNLMQVSINPLTGNDGTIMVVDDFIENLQSLAKTE